MSFCDIILIKEIINETRSRTASQNVVWSEEEGNIKSLKHESNK